MPYLLHEDPMAFPAPSNHPRIKCEKTQINNWFESILDEDVPYSILVKNITTEETMDMFKVLQCIFYVFYIYYIFNLEYPKKLEATFFYSFRSSHRRCFERKGILRNLALGLRLY